MENARAGIILVMIVLSILLRINGIILIWTRRKDIPLVPSIILDIISPVLCLATISYTQGRSYGKDIRSPFKGTIVLMAALLLSQYMTGLIFIGALFMLNIPIPTGRALGPGSDGGSFQAEHILAIVSFSSLFIFLMLLIIFPNNDPIRYFKGKGIVKNSVIGILILGPLLILTYFISYYIGELGGGQPPLMVEDIGSSTDVVLLGIAIVVIAPFIEELFFRGYLFDQLRKKAGPVLTIVTTSLLFAIVHFSLASLVPIFLLGMIMGILRERSNSILPSIIFHSANNLLALIVIALN